MLAYAVDGRGGYLAKAASLHAEPAVLFAGLKAAVEADLVRLPSYTAQQRAGAVGSHVVGGVALEPRRQGRLPR